MSSSKTPSDGKTILRGPDNWEAWFRELQGTVTPEIWELIDPSPAEAVAVSPPVEGSESEGAPEAPAPTLKLRKRPKEPRFDSVQRGAANYMALFIANMKIFDRLFKMYKVQFKVYKEEQKEPAVVRTKIQETVSSGKRLHFKSNLIVKEWLLRLQKDTKPKKGYIKAKVIKRYRKLCEGFKPQRAIQWIDEWEEVISLIIDYNFPEVHRER